MIVPLLSVDSGLQPETRGPSSARHTAAPAVGLAGRDSGIAIRLLCERVIRWMVAASVLAAALIVAGCGSYEPKECPETLGFYLSSPQDLARVRSVAFIELDSPLADEPRARQLSESVYEDLQKRNLFNVEFVTRDDFRCRQLPLDVNRPLDLRQMQQIRKALGCDAVVLGEMYHFQPYPRTRVAMQLRMIDLKNGKLVWGIKHTWDATDKDVNHRIHEYWEDEVRKGFEPAQEELVQMSPRWFLKFVSWEAVGTLPCSEDLLNPAAPPKAKPLQARAAEGVKKVAELAKED